MSQRDHERIGLGLGVLNKIFFVLRPKTWNIDLGLWANPIRFPWIVALNILHILLMSCPTLYMILSWALGSLE
jgi:hypothetical protein